MEQTTVPPFALINMEKIKIMLAACQVQPQRLEELPESFTLFMKQRGLNLEELAIPIPRYVRVKPGHPISSEELAASLGVTEDNLVQIEQFYWAINPALKINHCPLYEKGVLYGMDYSSAVAVKCLSLEKGMEVLQLCSAPGNKAMLMADSFDVSVTGVQISENRANIMRSLVRKYGISERVKVLVQDAVRYQPDRQYDRVLVDAECTHEGSLKHIYKFVKQQEGKPGNRVAQKMSKQQAKQFKRNNSNPYTSQINRGNRWSEQDFEERFLDAFKLKHLNELQRGLLRNGVRCLKEGGILVYSTCSFDPSQNEEVVQDELKMSKEQLELLDATEGLQCAVGWQPGRIKGTLRLSPSMSCCGGMFIAKIRKVSLKVSQALGGE